MKVTKLEQRIAEIQALQDQSSALEPNSAELSTMFEQLSQFSSDFLEKQAESKTYYGSEDRKEDPDAIHFNPSSVPIDFQRVLAIYQEQVQSRGINAASGGHLGYIPGGGLPLSAFADFIAALSNEYAGIFYASPGAANMEADLLDWMKSIFSWPKEATGNLTSGGSISTLIAVTSARDAHKIKGDRIAKSVVYVGAQTHHCLHKALKIAGLEDLIIRLIPLDDRSRLLPDALEKQIMADLDQGLNPWMVVGSAGTTDTGAIDPLKELADIASANGLWFHVDAAYGGFFILSKRKQAAFIGIERADSLVVDPHKSLFLPYGIGAVLIRDPESSNHSHKSDAPYMQDAYQGVLPFNPADSSPELTKHFRALRMWLPLKLLGLKPLVACLEEKLLLTTYLRDRLQALGFTVGPEPDLSVIYFWKPGNSLEEENDFNRRLLAEIHRDGRVFFSSTTLEGRFVIRAALLSFRTKLETVDRAIDLVYGYSNALSRKTSKINVK